MIDPEEIRRKAIGLYPKFVSAWLAGEKYFPKVLKVNRRPDKNLAVAGEQVERLRAGAKERRGFGYSVDWREVNARVHGKNEFPERVYIESQDDLLRLVGKQQEFAAYSAAVASIRERYPVLNAWIINKRNYKVLARVADKVEGLLEVTDCLVDNPSPQKFARELPLSVDTKFIERHERILHAWLDIVLPPHEVRADETHFERRFGLRYDEPYFVLRFLDPALQVAAEVPWSECAVPMSLLTTLPPPGETVVIVENKVNLLTLPPLSGAIGLGGLGNGVIDLRYLPWLRERRVWYWGDIDVDGFEILARLRKEFPEMQSVMMDEQTALVWGERIGSTCPERDISLPMNLSDAEQRAFTWCVEKNLRIEQEHIPQSYVREVLQQLPFNRPLRGPEPNPPSGRSRFL